MQFKTNRQKTVTSKDVARKAGVSQSTVSRVLNQNNTIKVHEDARKRVLDAAKSLGYIPNAIAQTMASGRSKLIGVVASSTYNLFYSHATLLLANAFQRKGFRTMLIPADPTEDSKALLHNLYQYRMDGAIITSSALSHHVTDAWTERGLPVILFNGYLPGQKVHAVQSDQYGSGLIMADYLVNIGHHRFAYISTEHSAYQNYAPRQQGFLDGLQKWGISDCQVVPADYSYKGGYQAGKQLFTNNNPPDAVFCSGDLNGFGMIDAVRDIGLMVGREVSVTGYDTPIVSHLPPYSMTALSQQVNLLAEDAVAMMLQLIETPTMTPQLVTRPMSLTIRASSRPLP